MDRVKRFDGVLNFRDCGGYAGQGGRVRAGRLYRSAQFSDASEADVAALDALGVDLVVDLRRPEERAAQPNRWPGQTPRTVVDDAGAAALPPHLAILTRTDLSAEATQGFMRDVYFSYPTDPRYLTLFKAMFDGLLEADGAVVVHCAAGKDRTGVACALALSAVGVSRADVFADYELTNQAVDIDARLPHLHARIEKAVGRTIDPHALRPMLGVEASYLEAAFAAIDAIGPMDRYLETVLGLDDGGRARLRARLLE